MADGLRGYIEGLRTLLSDTFLTFPLIMIGFIFILGVLTSNSGLLFLLFGHLFVVPSLEFIANEPGPAWFQGSIFSAKKLITWLFSVFLVIGVNANALGGGNYYLLFFLSLIPFLGQFVLNKSDKNVTPLYFFNPFAWLMTPNTGSEERAASTCSMVPGVSDEDRLFRTPSYWLAHLVFFFGFFFTNALAIYNEPAPKLTGPNTTEKQQASLNARVAHRKWMAGGAIAMGIVILAIFMIFRYFKTPCEARFIYSAIPLILIGFTGASWFEIIYKSCGVRPADILGIVQGFLSPNMLDTPIVCIGSEDTTPPPATTCSETSVATSNTTVVATTTTTKVEPTHTAVVSQHTVNPTNTVESKTTTAVPGHTAKPKRNNFRFRGSS